MRETKLEWVTGMGSRSGFIYIFKYDEGEGVLTGNMG